MPNTQELQGSWNKIRGQLKEKWNNLTDEDLHISGANIDQIVGKIQQKTGESREAIERFLDSLTSNASGKFSQAAEVAGKYAEQAGQYAQQAGAQLKDRYQDVAQQMQGGYEQVERTVKSNPAQSVAAAFGVGIALGVLVGLSMRSR